MNLTFLQGQIMCKLYKSLCEARTRKCQSPQSVKGGHYMEEEKVQQVN